MKRILPDSLHFILEDIGHDWVRTLLTVLGMAVVIFSYFILSAFSQSLSEFNQARVKKSRNLIVVQAEMVDPSEAVLDKSALQAAKEMPTDLVSKVSPFIFRQLRINDHIVQLRATNVEDWLPVFHMDLREGQWPSKTGEVIVGEGAAIAYHWKVGSILKIYGSDFRISGIVFLPGSVFASVWMPLDQAQSLFGLAHDYQLMYVQAAPGADAEIVRQELLKDPRINGKFSVFFEDTYGRRNNQFFKDVGSVISIASNLALLAVTFGTYSSTNLSLAERGREIGILRSEGFSHKLIGNLMNMRALLQGWMAYFLGLAAAIIYVAYQKAFAQLFVLGFNFAFKITPEQVFFGLLLTSILVIFGSWLSSRRILEQSISDLFRS
jgi:ABC-type antimicrobial peptide transport system permease subunit